MEAEVRVRSAKQRSITEAILGMRCYRREFGLVPVWTSRQHNAGDTWAFGGSVPCSRGLSSTLKMSWHLPAHPRHSAAEFFLFLSRLWMRNKLFGMYPGVEGKFSGRSDGSGPAGRRLTVRSWVHARPAGNRMRSQLMSAPPKLAIKHPWSLKFLENAH